jgi:hypothetical protein
MTNDLGTEAEIALLVLKAVKELEVRDVRGTSVVVDDGAIQELHVTAYGKKFATTVFAALTLTVHVVPLTESHPVHPLKMETPAGFAVSVTTVPRAYGAEQAPPQLMPAGVDVTVPLPSLRGPLVF